MDYEEYNKFCQALPATEYVMQWGGAHVWKVGGKVFAIGGWENMGMPAYSFKVSDLNFEVLKREPGYRPAPYMASRGMKWIQQCDASETHDESLQYYLSQSHKIVAAGLSKKKQKALGLIKEEQ